MKAFRKDFFREISKNKGRFLSVFFIVLLGAAFFSGIRASEGDMKISADRYYDEVNYMDLRVIGTLGLTGEDLADLKAVDGVETVTGGRTLEVLQKIGETEQTVKLIALNDTVNLPQIKEGRMPEKEGEILVDTVFLTKSGCKIGDKVTFTSGTEDPLSDSLSRDSFTIVGTATLPYYMDLSRGTGSIGNGTINSFALVLPEVFTSDLYTEIYLTVDGAKELQSYGTEYEKKVDSIKKKVEDLEEASCERRYENLWEEGSQKISDAKKEVSDAEKELSDAKKKQEDGEQQLLDAKETIAGKEEELKNGEQELSEKEKELQSAKDTIASKTAELDQAKAAIEKSAEQLKNGKAELEQKTKELETGKEQVAAKEQEIAGAEASLTEQEQVIRDSRDQLEAAKAALAQKESELAENREALEAQKAAFEGSEEEREQAFAEMEAALGQAEQSLAETKAGLQAKEAELAAGEEKISASRAELAAGKETLEQTKEVLSSGEAELSAARKKSADGEAELSAAREKLQKGEQKLKEAKAAVISGETKLAEARQQMEDGKKALADAKQETVEKEQELLDGKADYEKAVKEAEPELAEAKQKISDGEQDLSELKKPTWYVWGRDKITCTDNFGLDAERISNIGDFFPVIFFLVAALISLTTMTRMVEEQRQQIGTLKALGYSDGAIAGKYFAYAMLSTLSGAFAGVVIGEKILPWVIMNAYGMLYTGLPYYLTPLNWKEGGLAILASAFCTGAATLMACYRELSAKPAELMRPEAPKNGRRILLERIGILWKHLNFTQKSTIRNLVRYKKRFFMTVIGIGGCMGLIVVGFGLQDSITAIAKNQFVRLFTYQASIMLDGDEAQEAKEKIQKKLEEEEGVDHILEMYAQNIDLESDKKIVSGALEVPADLTHFEEFFDFRNRKTKEHYDFPEEGAAISEKTADLLGVSVGDTIRVKKGDDVAEVKISVIVENYVRHFLYIRKDTYQEMFGKEPSYNQLLLRYGDTSAEYENALGTRVMKMDGVLAVSFTTKLVQDIDDMLRSLDIVVLVLIVSAGLLAFVVIYNLNSINITERERELATLKVLGFYDGEVASYVYRENIILTFIGIVAGMGIGAFLHQYVIRTVEIEMMMFGRTVFLRSYALSALLTLIFACFVNFMMFYRLKKIDMIQSLKSVE